MTMLYVLPHPLGVIVSTRLDDPERKIFGDIQELLIPGDEFCGLSFDQLAQIAETTHKVDVT